MDSLDLLCPLLSQEKKKDIIDMNDMIKEKVHGAPFLTFLGAWNLLHFFDEQRDSSFGDPPLRSWNTVSLCSSAGKAIQSLRLTKMMICVKGGTQPLNNIKHHQTP